MTPNLMATAHAFAVEAARRSFLGFLEYAGTDDEGRPFRIRDLDRFVWSWIEACWADGAAACTLLPVGSGKTTHAAWRIAWEIGLDPNLLASLVTASHDDSCERVQLVRDILGSPRYREVFPHVRIAGRDAQDGFVVARTGRSHNYTLSAHGVLTGEGVRAHLLVLDDVVNQKNALHEPGSRKKVLRAVRGTWTSRLKFGARTPPRALWLQTSFHEDDAAAATRKDPKSGWRFMIVRAEPPFEHLGYEEWRCGAKVKEGTLPLHFPKAELERRWDMMGPPHNFRSLANRPISDADQPFKEKHLEGPEPLGPKLYQRRILYVDPAGDATKARTGDPDHCAAIVLGLLESGKWDVIFASRVRDTPSGQAAFVVRTAARFHPHAMWIEVNRDEAMLDLVVDRLRLHSVTARPRGDKVTVPKELRIRDLLEPALEYGDLRVCGRAFPELAEEMLAFPVAAHDDLLDALAGCWSKTKVGRSLLLGGVGSRNEFEIPGSAISGPGGMILPGQRFVM